MRCIMMAKALNRIGIQGDVNSGDKDIITVLTDSYILKLSDKEIVCKTIAEILQKLN